MSLRHVKKLQKAKLSQEASDHSDNEYEPPCVTKSSKSAYEGLILSSSSDEEADSSATSPSDKERYSPDQKADSLDESTRIRVAAACTVLATPGTSASAFASATTSKKTEKKKKKKKQKSKHTQPSSSWSALDEVEQSVSEVNAMLGEPSTPQEKPTSPQVDHELEEKEKIFSIKRKHLNANNELARLLGPETNENSKKNRRYMNRINKCKLIQRDYKFQKLGLSMSVVHRDAKNICFVFDHSKAYQKLHTEFVSVIESRKSNLIAPIDTSLKYMHVEGLIEAAEVMFRFEDSTTASDVIEQAIAYMQYAALPSFNLLDLRTRLEYKYRENRAFHIMLLKYIHLLSNRACHRTGLELAKILLNLDPTDPLGVLFFIDVLALRAREFSWLTDAVVYLEKQNMIEYMFNIKYSRALAQFHTSKPDTVARETADAHIQHALLSYPWALRQILHHANHSDRSVLEFTLYGDYASNSTTMCLQDVLALYAAFTATQWREPTVMDWLLDNAKLLGQSYESEPLLKQGARVSANERAKLFPNWPDRIHRHLAVIFSMSNLLVESGMPQVKCKHSYDPLPPADTIIRTHEGATTLHAIYYVEDFVIAPDYDSYDSDDIFIDSDDFSDSDEDEPPVLVPLAQVPPVQVPPVQEPLVQVPPVQVPPDLVPPVQVLPVQVLPVQVPAIQMQPVQVPPVQVLPVQVPLVHVLPVQVQLVQVPEVNVQENRDDEEQVNPTALANDQAQAINGNVEINGNEEGEQYLQEDNAAEDQEFLRE